MTDPYMPVKAKTSEWGTPPEIFDPLNEEFHFTLDAAASAENAKCKKYFTKEQDGIEQSWAGHTVWLNPPYDAKSLNEFTLKVIYEAKENSVTTVMLAPCKTDQSWWHNLVIRDPVTISLEIRWIEGRVKFVGAKHSAPFPSVIVIVRPK